ncbi:MAG: hypothetical protein ACM3ML_27385 [Micromonosporaceae bacterium]
MCATGPGAAGCLGTAACPFPAWPGCAAASVPATGLPLRSPRKGQRSFPDRGRGGAGFAGAAFLFCPRETSWRDLYGVEEGGVVLVRPDGYAAWRSTGPPPTSHALAAALRVAAGYGPGDNQPQTG